MEETRVDGMRRQAQNGFYTLNDIAGRGDIVVIDTSVFPSVTDTYPTINRLGKWYVIEKEGDREKEKRYVAETKALKEAIEEYSTIVSVQGVVDEIRPMMRRFRRKAKHFRRRHRGFYRLAKQRSYLLAEIMAYLEERPLRYSSELEKSLGEGNGCSATDSCLAALSLSLAVIGDHRVSLLTNDYALRQLVRQYIADGVPCTLQNRGRNILLFSNQTHETTYPYFWMVDANGDEKRESSGGVGNRLNVSVSKTRYADI